MGGVPTDKREEREDTREERKGNKEKIGEEVLFETPRAYLNYNEF